MLTKTSPEGNKDFLNHDVIRESIRKSCNKILLYSSKILQSILQKEGVVSPRELAQNYPQIPYLPGLESAVNELCSTLKGQAYFMPEFLQFDEGINAAMSSIARPIFIEEAQIILQSQGCIAPSNSSNLQHNQQQAPSLEQSQYTVAGDEIHDSDNDLSDL
ncbi:hypothetical protein [Candidatus Fokinia crypta]|uniref:Uncharacterized protein n=1 Tax=Candidatus Fokinia crypta TaxID=1920990 RepID=A0ABZ0UQU9_9RICK|nr:hypothetical protein [Candidatus Fokinia cryptica]WPX97937.1 hypothetical protein Fokcrypt_00461 [Candidatus Fokinia cryptica]